MAGDLRMTVGWAFTELSRLMGPNIDENATTLSEALLRCSGCGGELLGLASPTIHGGLGHAYFRCTGCRQPPVQASPVVRALQSLTRQRLSVPGVLAEANARRSAKLRADIPDARALVGWGMDKRHSAKLGRAIYGRWSRFGAAEGGYRVLDRLSVRLGDWLIERAAFDHQPDGQSCRDVSELELRTRAFARGARRSHGMAIVPRGERYLAFGGKTGYVEYTRQMHQLRLELWELLRRDNWRSRHAERDRIPGTALLEVDWSISPAQDARIRRRLVRAALGDDRILIDTTATGPDLLRVEPFRSGRLRR